MPEEQSFTERLVRVETKLDNVLERLDRNGYASQTNLDAHARLDDERHLDIEKRLRVLEAAEQNEAGERKFRRWVIGIGVTVLLAAVAHLFQMADLYAQIK